MQEFQQRVVTEKAELDTLIPGWRDELQPKLPDTKI